MMISQDCQLERSSTAQALARMPGLDMPGAAWRLVPCVSSACHAVVVQLSASMHVLFRTWPVVPVKQRNAVGRIGTLYPGDRPTCVLAYF